MLIALHGLALRKASDAISPLNAVVEPGCCRTPPPSSRRQRRAPRARARGIGAIKVNAAPFLLVVQCRKAPRRIRGRERNQAQSAATIQGRHRCRRVAASGGEWRVGRPLLRSGRRGCRRVAASGVLVARCCAVARRGINLKRNGRSAAQPALRVATDVAHAGARRRFSAPPASPVRHQQTIATNKRSTSAAARRPPAAPQSAAQAAGAARAPRRSISHAHRSPRPRAAQSERCHKPPQRSC